MFQAIKSLQNVFNVQNSLFFLPLLMCHFVWAGPVLEVDSMLNLIKIKTTTLAHGQKAHMKGFYAAGPGEGIFEWRLNGDKSDKSLHNGGTIIDPTVPYSPQSSSWYHKKHNGPGTWVRLSSGALTVHADWFGVTRNDGIDDGHSLQAALKAALKENKYLYIQGIMHLRKPLTLSSRSKLKGSLEISGGFTAVAGFNLTSLLKIEDADGVQVRNLIFTMSPEFRGSAALIAIKDSENVNLENNKFISANLPGHKDWRSAVALQGGNSNVRIAKSYFSRIATGIQSIGSINGLNIYRNEFSEWNQYAVRVSKLAKDANCVIQNITVNRNHFHDIAIGRVKQTIYIVRTIQRFIRNVKVINNTIIGPGTPHIGDRGEQGVLSNNGSADQIVLHGVNGFEVARNTVMNGGEVGITISRLSRNGVIKDNVTTGNDGHGINLGCGLTVLKVAQADVSHFTKDQPVQGQSSLTTGIVDRIVGDEVWIRNTGNGSIFRANEYLKNNSTGIVAKVLSVHRTKNVVIKNNLVIDNAIDRDNKKQAVSGIFVFNTDNVTIVKNEIKNDALKTTGHGHQYSIHVNNSRNIVVDFNTHVGSKRQHHGFFGYVDVFVGDNNIYQP